MSSESSAISNLADLQDGQIVLPAFVRRSAEGLDVDLSAIDSRDLLISFAERVFGAGLRFVNLDYDFFLDLAFRWEPKDIDRRIEELRKDGGDAFVRLADDIVPFPPARRAFYRGVKVMDGGKQADYMFEPILTEVDDGAGGVREEKVRLDFDEFITDLWLRGVRFGIDEAAVRQAIEREKSERVAVARSLPPKEGKDASAVERTDKLHRDDAPKLRADGRIDLRQYSNRFPQVKAGTHLFEKLPRVPGVSGWSVQGKENPPAAVKDFDIATLAGPGTCIRREAGKEWVEAVADGFLDVDDRSGQVSVVDKIVNRAGVSMRTTGDLALAGDHYEEHGEVQEKRVVTGHHMTFLADVFGEISSDGGQVVIKANLSGGGATSPGGSIVVEGAAFNATLGAYNGTVKLARAENCVITAARVEIEQAVLCTIVADEVHIVHAEGCAIAAQQVAIDQSGARRSTATVVTMVMPDFGAFERGDAGLVQERVGLAEEVGACEEAIKAITAQEDIRTYLALQPKLRAGLTMNPQQQLRWQELLARIAPSLRQLTERNATLRADRDRCAEIDRALEQSIQARTEALAAISCELQTVVGDTLVRQWYPTKDEPSLMRLAPKDLLQRLRSAGGDDQRLFVGDSGTFSWRPQTAVPPESG